MNPTMHPEAEVGTITHASLCTSAEADVTLRAGEALNVRARVPSGRLELDANEQAVLAGEKSLGDPRPIVEYEAEVEPVRGAWPGS